MAPKFNFIDLTGQRFGKLVAFQYLGQNSHREQVWGCLCDCGKQVVKIGRCLRTGNVKSCGCLWKSLIGKHNLRHGELINGKVSREYRSWQAMKRRCSTNAPPKDRAVYFDKGIKVCSLWASSFPSFLEHMGRCPPHHQLERLDNQKGYEPGNCAWRTGSQNCRNKSNNRRITFNGESLTVTGWAEKLGVSAPTLFSRIYAGWSVPEILFGRSR